MTLYTPLSAQWTSKTNHTPRPQFFREQIPKMPQIAKIKELLQTSRSIYFQTPTSQIYVQTSSNPDEFNESLSHLSDLDYRFSLDHIIIPVAMPYAFMVRKKNMTQHWLTAPLGNCTLDILETLGYTKNPFPQRERSQLAFYEAMQKHYISP
ncbi:hypothetical protein DSO57_1005470 [Entomophthora muscae]|uniref:Uncharacterized protein n=1 Tax=Entomophthora muscae TaxID=34485 RepID=A0ACC2U5N7_9FUNG|nr:hypothetical protein DSO57_1005470 [Entomophthora muscae]